MISIMRKLTDVKEKSQGAISGSLIKTDHFKEGKFKLTELKILSQI